MIPLFKDEAVHCGLAQNFSWDLTVNHWKIAPLLSLMQAGLLKVFPEISPIIICRGTVMAANLLAVGLIFWLAKILSRKKLVAGATAVFYLLNPFSFFTSLTAMQEPMLNLFIIAALIWQPAIFFILAFFTKLNSILILPGLLLIKRNKFGLIIIACLLIILTLTQTKLWETVGYHTEINSLGKRILINLRLTISWYQQYLSTLFWPLLILGIWQMRQQWRWLFFPAGIILAYAVTATSYFPRYLFLSLPFLAIIIGYGTKHLMGKFILLLLILNYSFTDYTILTKPAQARIALEDHYQFFDDWTAGIGIEQALLWLEKQQYDYQLIYPEELAYSIQLYKQHLKIELNSGKEKILLVSAQKHAEFMNKERSDLLYASNGKERNSIELYRLTAN